MKISRCSKWALYICAPLALALVAVCESQDKSHAQEFWNGENDARIVRQTADHQAMLGAQADPTLYRCHFDGNNLNELGKAKLDAIVANGAPAKIYIDGQRDAMDGYRAAVSSYLAAAKVADGSVTIEQGMAPGTSSSATAALSRMNKTESPQSTSASNETTSDNSGSGMKSQ